MSSFNDLIHMFFFSANYVGTSDLIRVAKQSFRAHIDFIAREQHRYRIKQILYIFQLFNEL